MALKSLVSLGQPEQRLAVYTVTSPAVRCLSILTYKSLNMHAYGAHIGMHEV